MTLPSTVPADGGIAASAGGDAEPADAVELDDLFRRYHAELVRIAALMVRDQPTAEDVVQDVFTRIHARPGIRPRAGFELAYLRASVLNGCRSVHRRRTLARRLGIDSPSVGGDRGDTAALTADPWPGHTEPVTAESAESAAIRAEERRRVLAALAVLPSQRREVLVLRYYLGLSQAEIAATLGISQGAVKSATSRGLAALAGQLGEDA